MVPTLSPDENGLAPFDCDHPGPHDCGAEYEVKRRYHCGWINEAEWIDPSELPDAIGEGANLVRAKEIGICPGWLVRQRFISEASLGSMVLDGAFSTVFPGHENTIIEASILMKSAWNTHEANEMRKMKNRQ